MMQKSSSRFVAILMIVTFMTSCMSTFSKSNKEVVLVNTSTPKDVVYSNEMIGNNYTMASGRYTTSLYDGDTIEIPVDTAYVDTSVGKLTSDNYEYKNDVVDLTIGESASFTINAPKAAQYYVSFDYLAYSDTILPVELYLYLNGETPFYEARRLIFESTWVDKKEKSYDRYGNEIVSIPEKLKQWENKFLMDTSYRYSTPLALELKEGVNIIELNISEGSVLLGNIYLSGETAIPEYTKADAMAGDLVYEIEAERMDFRNNSSIRPIGEYDAALTPYDTSSKVLNVIDSASFSDAGQSVTYKFKVDNDGYYNLAFAYKQSDKTDFPVFGDIKIDGEIPNALMQAYPFDYVKDYKNLTLVDTNNEAIAVFMEAGEHTISLTINSSNTRHVLEAVDRIMSEINDLALEITKVAGKNKDKYRDLDIARYIPDVEDRLTNWANQLDSLQESVKQYNTEVDKISAFSSLSVASSRLRSLAKEPNKIAYRINELAQSTNSVTQYLANLIDILNKNRLALDKVYIYQADGQLPTGAGIFESMYLSVARFFSSFTSQAYSSSNIDDSHLQVWVNRSRQHVEILQKMIDESFTPATGIKVDVSLMPDQNKLILANASGDAPDVAASINYAIPFELGIRGAIKDLTEFEDYSEILSRSVDGLHIPATIGDGIYAVPETINFWVMYYRTDILDKLGLEIPNTMSDVKEMLPELQMRGMNFYYPTAGMVALKTFHGTTPLLFQYDASLYGRTAGNTTINSEAAIKGFTELTELFTIYNLPVDVPSFYQHFRNGDMPIGIAEYNMYNLLTNAAPEIANSWDIAVVPGIENEDGEVVRYSSGGAESSVIFNSTEEKEQQAWEYLKWWSSTETQVEFGQTLQITYGEEYIWNTANTEAFAQLPWKTEDKAVIMEQTDWLLESPRILGTYMLEREMSNAYNAVVVDGKDMRITIDSAVKRIDRETERKLTEFGYLSPEGEVIKDYIVPNIDIVRDILYEKE